MLLVFGYHLCCLLIALLHICHFTFNLICAQGAQCTHVTSSRCPELQIAVDADAIGTRSVYGGRERRGGDGQTSRWTTSWSQHTNGKEGDARRWDAGTRLRASYCSLVSTGRGRAGRVMLSGTRDTQAWDVCVMLSGTRDRYPRAWDVGARERASGQYSESGPYIRHTEMPNTRACTCLLVIV